MCIIPDRRNPDTTHTRPWSSIERSTSVGELRGVGRGSAAADGGAGWRGGGGREVAGVLREGEGGAGEEEEGEELHFGEICRGQPERAWY